MLKGMVHICDAYRTTANREWNLNRCLLNFAYLAWFTDTNTHSIVCLITSKNFTFTIVPSTKKNVHKMENYCFVQFLVNEKKKGQKVEKQNCFHTFSNVHCYGRNVWNVYWFTKTTHKRCSKHAKRCWFIWWIKAKEMICEFWCTILSGRQKHTHTKVEQLFCYQAKIPWFEFNTTISFIGKFGPEMNVCQHLTFS